MGRLILLTIINFIIGVVAYDGNASTLRVSGLVVNVVSGAYVPGVSFYTVLDNRRKTLCEGDTNGRFSFDLPANGQSIFMEKNGFRSASAPVTVHRQEGNNTVFFVKLPLIPIDKQALDSPYMQSEQKDYTLSGSAAIGKPVTKTLHVLDALTGQQIDRAAIMLNFTKGKKVETREITPENPEAKLLFTQPDIIGFSIKAEGYQTYTGNLILEKIDGSNARYEVRLSPQINLLSLYLSGDGDAKMCTAIAANGKEVRLQKADSKTYCALLSEGDYGLKIIRANGSLLHFERIALAKGINFLEIAKFDKKELPPPRAAATVKTEVRDAPEYADLIENELTTVYFNQSEYLLKQEEKNKLDALADRLRSSSGQKIRVVGHTDNVGDPKRNLMLSEYRARVIRSYLLNKKVPEKQILFTWVGGKFPVRKNDSEENKKMNRRVEITVLPKI